MIRKIIHSPQALIGLAMMLIVFLVMVFAPFLAPNDPMQLNVATVLLRQIHNIHLGQMNLDDAFCLA